MIKIDETKKIREYDITLRKDWDDLEYFLAGVNKMILNGSHCILKYHENRHLLRIKIYRCRFSFSSVRLSCMLKDIDLNQIKDLSTCANIVGSYNGYIQFSIVSPGGKNFGPTIHISMYLPKDAVKSNLLKQTLESTN